MPTTTTAPTTTTVPTTTQTPPPGYPASYFTGPLGAANPLPVYGSKMLILWHDIQGNTWAQTQSEIVQRETDAGRSFDGLGIHYGGGGTFGGVASCAYINTAEKREQWIHDQGSLPVVSWSPNATLAQINSGAFDGCYRAVADYEKQFPFPVMLRLMWEFDGNWMTWQGCGQPYIDAWRRIVGIFQAEGATNVGFWWVPTEGFSRACADSSYPGDAYVDWVGSDGYNHAGTGWSTPLHAGWAEWWELFNYTGHGTSTPSKYALYGAEKPFVVGETGSKPDPNDATRKGNWDRNIAAAPYGAAAMPDLVGVQFFDQNVPSEPNNWLVDYPASQPDAYAGWLELVHTGLFGG